MTYTAAIIGAGQLGSRHLQGLKTAKLPLRIEVMDRDETALSTASTRYDETPENHLIDSVRYFNNIELLSSNLDLVIVATGSMPRAAVIKELLQKKNVRNLVLEKVLFPDTEQYTEIANLLKDKNLEANTWVNCARRMFSGYEQLKHELGNRKNIECTVTGSNWGLACNGVHFIDLFAFLISSDDKISEINTRYLEPEIHQSKRLGYIEFMGTLIAGSTKGSVIKLTCFAGDNISASISISAENSKFEIDESKNIITKNGEKWADIGIMYQSQMTGLLAEEILNQNNCRLTSYMESAEIHLKFLHPLVLLYNELTNSKGSFCPIT
ncbi:MAG: Gfo/Idh/MocA family oxidoreductase [Prevotellaceae bacterium]|jgi:predicted dehydrogenase|nr:Gfo/Idh/MocA family oxidoreductase [Prevotellaceae bacterium]